MPELGLNSTCAVLGLCLRDTETIPALYRKEVIYVMQVIVVQMVMHLAIGEIFGNSKDGIGGGAVRGLEIG